MLVDIEEIISFCEADSDYESGMITVIHEAVEKWIKNHCRRDLELTTYTERYNGDGEDELDLRNYPIISITRVSIGNFNCIRVKNTASETIATVSVNSTGIVLTKDGVSDNSVVFETYITMADVVTAINLISGWEAQLADSKYNNYQSTELIQLFGRNAIDNNYVSLFIPQTPLGDFEVDSEAGILHRSVGFTEGFQNILVEYQAGYSEMPEDLRFAVKILTNNMFIKRKDETFGVIDYSIGGIKINIDGKDVPMEVRKILTFYRRYLI